MSDVHGIDDATALVGLPELVVRGQMLRDGESWRRNCSARSAPPRDLAHARRWLIVFFEHGADANVGELTRLARTIDRW